MKEEGVGGLLGLTGFESSIYPGSGPFRKVKPLLLPVWLYYFGEITVYKDVAAQIGSGARVSRVRCPRLQLPPVSYIDGRVPGDRT